MTRKAIAVDLDGTLCLRNTFNIFLRQHICASLPAAPAGGTVRMDERAPASSHKSCAHEAVHPRAILSAVADTGRLGSRHGMAPRQSGSDSTRGQMPARGICHHTRHGRSRGVCVSDSARFGLEYCIATPQPDSWKAWGEARGCAKRDAVVRLAEEKSLVLDIAVSDHADDMPLLEAAATAILVELPVGNLRRI